MHNFLEKLRKRKTEEGASIAELSVAIAITSFLVPIITGAIASGYAQQNLSMDLSRGNIESTSTNALLKADIKSGKAFRVVSDSLDDNKDYEKNDAPYIGYKLDIYNGKRCITWEFQDSELVRAESKTGFSNVNLPDWGVMAQNLKSVQAKPFALHKGTVSYDFKANNKDTSAHTEIVGSYTSNVGQTGPGDCW